MSGRPGRAEPAAEPGEAPILFYDGTCGLCARSVQFLLRHEGRRRDLRFASLDGPTGTSLFKTRAIDSLVWYEPSRGALTRSGAAIRAARYLGGGWAVAGWLAFLVPRPIRDWVYDQVARHRHRIAGPACVIPTAAQRPRFLDQAGP